MDQPWTLAAEIRHRMSALGLNPKRLSLSALGCSRADLLPPAERAAEARGEGAATRLDPALLNRALAIAERLSADDKVLASEIASVAYRLIERERDGHPVTDDEVTLRILEEFVRRIQSVAASFR